MSTGTNIRAAFTRKIVLHAARFEAYLSTHAFEILFLGLYLVANILMYIWGAHDEWHHTMKAHPDKPQFKWYIAIARGAGYTLNLNCSIVLILASKLFMTAIRDSPLHKVLPLDKSFPAAHIIVGYFILIGVAIHVPFHFVWIFKYNMLDELTLWSFTMTVACGVPLLVIFLTMFSTAIPWFRRKFFRVFYLIHVVGATLFFILLSFHGMYNKKPETYKWIAPAMILYIIDRIARKFKTSTVDIELSSFHSTLRSGDVLELRLPKLFGYSAGQYAEISVPFISKEWHPFTIASAPYEDTMTFYIKATGDWTRKLYQQFEQRISNPSLYNMKARVRGPYGAPAQHGTKEYERVVLISGGIGGTPFASISKDLHHRRENMTCQYPTFLHSEAEAGYDDERVPLRVSMAVDKLYDLNCFEHDGLMRRRSSVTSHISNTLALEKSNGLTRVISKVSKRGNNTAVSDTILDFGEDSSSRPRNPIFNRFRAHALTFLHTTRVSLFLLFTLVVRFSLVCIIAIWRLGDFKWTLSKIRPEAYWAICTDAALGILLFSFMALTVTLEMSIMRQEYFSNPGRCMDFLGFLPCSLLSTTLSLRSVANPDRVRGTMTLTHFSIFLPVLFILLSYRMYRSVGSRTLLDRNKKKCGCACGQSVPDVDYVWTTPQADDDGWLRDELSSLAEGTDLRLHRYITRENVVSSPSSDHIQAYAGRPDWDELFESIVDCTHSSGEVGVFFCGPPKMGTAIRNSLRDVEVRSNLRGSYLFSLTDKDMEKHFSAKSKEDVRRLRSFGCNVRFVFREENF